MKKSFIEININVNDPSIREILIAILAEKNFESFEELPEGIKTHIDKDFFDPDLIEEISQQYNLNYSYKEIEDENWNAKWEENFEPVIVSDFAAIRAHFHLPIPKVRHEIIITPKMSFGTGHHATTYMMVQQMEHINFNNASVFDFGTGTGILAILSEKLNAKKIVATDNDEWSIKNARENIENNCCQRIQLIHTELVPNLSFDIILANINKNILLKTALALFYALKQNGILVVSGLLTDDEHIIIESFQNVGLQHNFTTEKTGWLCISFTKPA